jgi:hypothetical protein
LAMAANRGPLSARITRLLGISNLRSGIRGIGLTASVLCLTVALVAGNAIFGIRKASGRLLRDSARSTDICAGTLPRPRTTASQKNFPRARPPTSLGTASRLVHRRTESRAAKRGDDNPSHECGCNAGPPSAESRLGDHPVINR